MTLEQEEHLASHVGLLLLAQAGHADGQAGGGGGGAGADG